MASPGLRGIVVAHGTMAYGVVDAVRAIVGADEDALVAVSNAEKGPSELASELERLLEGRPGIIFTDLHGGSCAASALAASRRDGTAVVYGANLPMLLDFILHRELPTEDLLTRLVETGRQGIHCFQGARPIST